MKKKIIIIGSIIGIIIISISSYLVLINMNKKDISNSVDDFFNCIKQEEQITKNKYISINNFDIKEIVNNSNYYELLVQDLDYKILNVEGDFNDAIVLVEVSNKSSEESIKGFLKKRKEVKRQLVEESSDEEKKNAEIENTLSTDNVILKEQVELANTVENIIKLELHKENKRWIISDANINDILNVILPDIDNISDEFIEEIKKEDSEDTTEEKIEEVNNKDNNKNKSNKKSSNKQQIDSSTTTVNDNTPIQTSNPAPAQQQAQQPAQAQSQSSTPQSSSQSSASIVSPAPEPTAPPVESGLAPSPDTMAPTMADAEHESPVPSAQCTHSRTGPATIMTPEGVRTTTVCLDCGAEV